jgi:anaerobic magnesium-protoporphyrin IX monomethyl ester cyclase
MNLSKSVVIVAPNAFERFLTAGVESQFQILTKSNHLASFTNLLRTLNSFGNRSLDPGQKKTNPMAGYYLESFLKQRGWMARVVFEWDDDVAVTEAMSIDPLAVMFSTTYVTDRTLLAMSIESLIKVIGDVPLIVGGPYIWKQKYEINRNQQLVSVHSLTDGPLARSDALKAYNVDTESDSLFSVAAHGDPPSPIRKAIYIADEFGEYSLLRLLQALERGQRTPEALTDVPNLVLPLRNGSWHHTVQMPDPIDLNRDYTRWDLVDQMPSSVVPLRTSVGCPFKCEYCDFIQLHPQVRARSPQSLKEEIILAKRRGAAFFNFIDDNIFLSKERIKQLTTMIIDNELDIRWRGFFRVDRVDETNIEEIRKSGCYFGMCGIESGDREMLRRMRKGCREDEAHRGIDLCTGVGIQLLLTFIVGYPGETRESLDNTLEFVNSLRRDNMGHAAYQIYPFYLLPSTGVDNPEYRADFQLMGRFSNWTHSTMNSDEVKSVWAPYFFKNANLSYEYYSNERFFAVDQRNRAIDKRKELTVAFIDNRDDETIQQCFSGLCKELPLLNENPHVYEWKQYLAPRECQPGIRQSPGAFR